MTIKIFSLPSLAIVKKSDEKGKFLERLTYELDCSGVIVSVMNNKDPRINIIDFITEKNENAGRIYYSETLKERKILTLNLGYNYTGLIFSKDYKEKDLADVEHWPENILKEKHLERIRKIGDIREDLNPEEVSKKYQDFFYNLKKFA